MFNVGDTVYIAGEADEFGCIHNYYKGVIRDISESSNGGTTYYAVETGAVKSLGGSSAVLIRMQTEVFATKQPCIEAVRLINYDKREEALKAANRSLAEAKAMIENWLDYDPYTAPIKEKK